MSCLPRVEILGLWLNDVSEDDVITHLVSSVRAGRGGRVVTPNVDILRQATGDPQLRDLLAESDVVLADGMPVVWASRLQGTPLRARVPTSELIYPLAEAAADNGLSMFLLGDEDEVARCAAGKLEAYAPGLEVVGTYSPPFGAELDPPELSRIVSRLEDTSPDIVVCAFGFPKQERLMAELQPLLPGSWLVAAGGTLSMVAGRTPSAAPWMRRHGLEWLHRLRLEPRRLFSRYLVHDAPFAIRLLGTATWNGIRGRARRVSAMTAAQGDP